MVQIDRASDLISLGETAVVVKTDGRLFEWNIDGTGKSGNWRINKNSGRNLDKVILCIQKENQAVREILVAEYRGMESPEPSEQHKTHGRVVFRLTNIQRVGFTNVNWKSFAETGSYPVRYIP